MLNNDEAMKEADKSTEILWHRLADLFGLVSFENGAYTPHENVTDALIKVREFFPAHAFPEDFLVRGLSNNLGANSTVQDGRSFSKIEEV